MISALLDHLWQSTLVALAAGLLTLAFRKASPSVRHGLWLAASVKFLVPFAALAALAKLVLGKALAFPAVPLRAPEAAVLDKVAEPFSQAVLTQSLVAQGLAAQAPAAIIQAPLSPPPMTATAVHVASHLNPVLVILALWALGSALVLIAWAVRWSRVRQVVRSASRLNWPAAMPVLASPSLLEPGLVGLLRPVLVLPKTLPDHLNQVEIAAIVAHETAHLRRRDNLTAALHMVVEALFWFHPLVWWIGRRLIDERERACDEAVVKAGHNRAVYARSLVESCRHYLQSPLSCVAGASGSDLKTRVETIMTAPLSSPLSRSKKALLLAAGLAVVATPVMAGLITSPEGQKAVARAAVVASTALGVTLPAPVRDAAEPVVLARNEAVLAPSPSVVKLGVSQAPASLVQDIAAPAVDASSVEAAPVQPAPAVPSRPALTPVAMTAGQASESGRTTTERQIADYVQAHAQWTEGVKDRITRWYDPHMICARIVGLPADQAALVKARIDGVAGALKVETVKSNCWPNDVSIVFTTDYKHAIDRESARRGWDPDVAARNGWLVGRDGGDPKAPRIEPVMAWYDTGSGGNGGTCNTHFTCVVNTFQNQVMIVDLQRIRGQSALAVADYLTMLMLTEPRAEGRCGALPSITDLFAACPGRAAPKGLTPADVAYLNALYAVGREDNHAGEQVDVMRRMAANLAAGAGGARAEAAAEHPIRPAAYTLPTRASRPALTLVASAAPQARAQPGVSDFVQSFSGALWNDDPICVRVAGGEPGAAARVQARVEADARAAGLSIERVCNYFQARVEIRLSSDADGAVRDVLDEHKHPFWPFPLQKPAGANRPIQAWYGLEYDHVRGQAWASDDLRPDSGAGKKFAMAIVVIDPQRTAGLSLDAVADYAALLALSQPRALDRCNALPSVADLFAGACPGRTAPTALTAADSAYLSALYAGSEGIRATRSQSELIEAMAKRFGAARLAAL